MKTYLNFRNVSLALLVCIFLNSCAKDTDLLSEYIIRDSIKKEVLSFSIRADDIKVSTNGKVGSETIIKEDILQKENTALENKSSPKK